MSEGQSPAIPLYAEGAEEFRKGNYELAVELFRRAVELDEHFYRAYAYLGMALDKQGKIDEAIEAYRECIEIAPQYHKAFNNVGELYRRKGLLDYATMVFKMATENAPGHAPYYYNLGITYNDIGMKKKAEESLTRAFDLEPDQFQTVTELAQVRFELEMFDRALECLDKFLLEAPEHDRAPEVRARMNLLKRKVDEQKTKKLAVQTEETKRLDDDEEEAVPLPEEPTPVLPSPEKKENESPPFEVQEPEKPTSIRQKESTDDDETRPLPHADEDPQT